MEGRDEHSDKLYCQNFIQDQKRNVSKLRLLLLFFFPYRDSLLNKIYRILQWVLGVILSAAMRYCYRSMKDSGSLRLLHLYSAGRWHELVNSEELGRKQSWHNTNSLPKFAWRYSGTPRNISQDSRCSGRHSKIEHPE
jgi:hypothetical protein